VAVQSGFTDSSVASGNYLINTAGKTINFPATFTGAGNLISLVGTTTISGVGKLVLQSPSTVPGGGVPNVDPLANFVGNAWYVAPVNVATFTTVFTFDASVNGAATNQGFTFCIQNQPPATDFVNNNALPVGGINGPFDGVLRYSAGGLNAMGNGDGFGYSGHTAGGDMPTGLSRSVAVKFDCQRNGTGLYTANNASAFSSGGTGDVTSNTVALTGLTITNGHSFQVTLSYDGTTLSLTVKDLTTLTTFSHSWAVDIPTIVGGSTAYVGFTSGSFYGGVQEISNWTM